jgi:general secretion pathway protein D
MATVVRGGLLLSALLASGLWSACCDCEKFEQARAEAIVPAPEGSCSFSPRGEGPAGEALVTLSCTNAELADVIRAAAKITKKNFLFDDRVRGKVTIIPEQPVSAEEAYRVFEAVLEVKGFTIVEKGGSVLKVVPAKPEVVPAPS